MIATPVILAISMEIALQIDNYINNREKYVFPDY